jgi:hypothetical protein
MPARLESLLGDRAPATPSSGAPSSGAPSSGAPSSGAPSSGAPSTAASGATPDQAGEPATPDQAADPEIDPADIPDDPASQDARGSGDNPPDPGEDT